MSIKPTTSEVITDGQLKQAYFPKCANDDEYQALIQSKIDLANAEVRSKTGTNYTSTDPDTQLLLKQSIIYLALAELWLIIKQVIDTYDDESLPPEIADSDQAQANHDTFREKGIQILERYNGDTVVTRREFVGAFRSGGSTYSGPLGMGY
jgi:hypothetical protein